MGAAIVHRIQSYDRATDNTPILAFWQFDRINHITAKQVTAAMKDTLVAIGEVVLHIHKNKIGMHLIRSGAAMAMFLGECPVYLIIVIGHWSSNAFLCYIHKQFEQFSHNVSCKMTKYMFHRHIPGPGYTSPSISHLHPRQRNNPNNAKTRRNICGNIAQQDRLPAFTLYNQADHTVQYMGHNPNTRYFCLVGLRST